MGCRRITNRVSFNVTQENNFPAQNVNRETLMLTVKKMCVFQSVYHFSFNYWREKSILSIREFHGFLRKLMKRSWLIWIRINWNEFCRNEPSNENNKFVSLWFMSVFLRIISNKSFAENFNVSCGSDVYYFSINYNDSLNLAMEKFYWCSNFLKIGSISNIRF